MIRRAVLALMLGWAVPGAARAECACDDDDDGLAFLHRDHGDPAIGRHANETLQDYFARKQREVMRERPGIGR
jgi:hypothetical protein